MLHKTKHGAYLELVGRPKSWCKPAVASVQWSTTKLCEWKVTRSLLRAALPPHGGWKLYRVSFPRQFSEAGLGWGPGPGWACGRWARSLGAGRNPTQSRAEQSRAGRAGTGPPSSGGCPAPPAGPEHFGLSGGECALQSRWAGGWSQQEGLAAAPPPAGQPQEPCWNVIRVIWPKVRHRLKLSLLLTPTKCWGLHPTVPISPNRESSGYVAL